MFYAKNERITTKCRSIKKNNDRPQPYETLTWEVQSICQPQPYAADSQNLLHHREQEGQM